MTENNRILGLSARTLDALMPMHIWIGPTGHILQCGCTLQKLMPDQPFPGSMFFDKFTIMRPRKVKVLDQLSYITNEPNFTIINAISNQTCVVGVHAYLESIFLNLITNSYRYKRRTNNSFIKIAAHLLEDEVMLEFKDNGLGIDLDNFVVHKFSIF